MKNTHQQISEAYSKHINDMIGLPYSSFDCWDIVKLFHKKIMGNDLELGIRYLVPSQRNDTDSKEWAILSQWLIKDNKDKYFKKVSAPQFGDIIALRIFGMTAHLGVYLNDKTFLHTSETTGSMVDRLARWEKRIDGFYRFVDN